MTGKTFTPDFDQERCLHVSVGINIKMLGNSLKHLSNVRVEASSQSSAVKSELN